MRFVDGEALSFGPPPAEAVRAEAGIDISTRPGHEEEESGAGASLQTTLESVTITYIYDSLNRLTLADYSTGIFYGYTYDVVGNRLAEDLLVVDSEYEYDIANRLVSVNGIDYTWDDNGNLLDDGTYTYEYDAANRLVSVNGGTTSVGYTYNGFGNRVRQEVDGQEMAFTLDLASGLTQVLADGTYTYLYGHARLGQESAAGMAYFLTDALGSVRQLVDDSGVTLTRSYAPYGKDSSSSGNATSYYGYTGEWMDASGMVYLRARYYSPELGRFISRDRWKGSANEPMSYNAWLYTYENPINYTDPSGYRRDDPPPKDCVYCDPLQGQDRRACERIIRGISPASRSLPDSLVPYIGFDECSFLPNII